MHNIHIHNHYYAESSRVIDTANPAVIHSDAYDFRRFRIAQILMHRFVVLTHVSRYVEINVIKSVRLRDSPRVDLPTKKIHSSSFSVGVCKLKRLTTIPLRFSSTPFQRGTLAHVGNRRADSDKPSEHLSFNVRSRLYYCSSANLDSCRILLVLI